ncbi:MAG: hypothetical protein Q8R87_09420 [Anaerolineaceae bacterium]|jgi:hypothetical protein|nr:hypothetical protein [Anaerolineaceae bacterium]
MPKQSYSLEPGGPKRLEIQWKGLYKNTTITLDGLQLGTVLDQRLLRAGHELPLTDGSLLRLHLVSNLAGTELRVTRNGVPLPGSASNPETKVNTAAGIIFFVAGLNLLLGIIGLLTRSEFLATLGIGWYSIIFGAFFLVMGLLVKKRSMVALILSIVVFSLDALLGVIGSVALGGSAAIGGFVFRVFLIIPMVQGIGAIKALKKQSAPGVPPVV